MHEASCSFAACIHLVAEPVLGGMLLPKQGEWFIPASCRLPVLQMPSNDPAYAHWSYKHYNASLVPGNDCAMGYKDEGYDHFLGNSSSEIDAGNSSLFSGGTADVTHGWRAVQCEEQAPYICEIPADSFPCPPPSPPAPPPPMPPSPPFPPFPPNCEC